MNADGRRVQARRGKRGRVENTEWQESWGAGAGEAGGVELNEEQQRSSLAGRKREYMFKDASQRVMKAGHNEAERPCSYLQSIEKKKP